MNQKTFNTIVDEAIKFISKYLFAVNPVTTSRNFCSFVDPTEIHQFLLNVQIYKHPTNIQS